MQARTLIIDDEPLARMRLRSLLEKYTDDLEIVDEAASGNQAISKINDLVPDVKPLERPLLQTARGEEPPLPALSDEQLERLERPEPSGAALRHLSLAGALRGVVSTARHPFQ